MLFHFALLNTFNCRILPFEAKVEKPLYAEKGVFSAAGSKPGDYIAEGGF